MESPFRVPFPLWTPDYIREHAVHINTSFEHPLYSHKTLRPLTDYLQLLPFDTCEADIRTLQTIKCLLRHGADPNLANNDGNTPLHVACSRRNLPAIQLLLQHGARPNAQNKTLDTPLHELLHAGKWHSPVLLPCLKLLLEAGASVTLCNNWQFSVLNILLNHGLLEEMTFVLLHYPHMVAQELSIVDHCFYYEEMMQLLLSSGLWWNYPFPTSFRHEARELVMIYVRCRVWCTLLHVQYSHCLWDPHLLQEWISWQ